MNKKDQLKFLQESLDTTMKHRLALEINYRIATSMVLSDKKSAINVQQKTRAEIDIQNLRIQHIIKLKEEIENDKLKM